MKYFVSYCFLFLLLFTSADAQHIPSSERGTPLYRAFGQMELNKVRTTVFNHGASGRLDGSHPISYWTPYEWPKNSGQVYMAVTQLWVGAEVKDKNGKTIHIVEVSNYRNSPQGVTWSFEPVPGYFNKNLTGDYLLADSRRKETWPQTWPEKMNDASDPGWPGSWNGYFGRNKFFNGQEIYSKFTDNNYSRYPDYDPDSTDLARRGLGLVISSRIVEFADPLLEDIVFHIYKIKNDGTKPIDKASVAFWIGDFVGGEDDSQDDKVGYELSKNSVWFYDKDKKSPAFGSNPVGMTGIKIIKAPYSLDNSGKQLGLSSIRILPAATYNLSVTSDDELWNSVMMPGKYTNPASLIPGEYDTYFSCSYFSLKPGEETEVVLAFVMANGNTHQEEMDRFHAKARLAEEYFNSLHAMNKYNITLTAPAPGQAVAEDLNISYTLSGNQGKTRNIIFHSSDDGQVWNLLGIDSMNTGSLSVNTSAMKEGVLNRLAVYSFAENGYAYYGLEEPFTIKNPATNTKPQIHITSPAEGDSLSGNKSIKWNGGDADGDDCIINLYYKPRSTDPWTPMVTGLRQVNSYNWATMDFLNSTSYQLKGEIISNSDTSVFISPVFALYNPRIIYPDDIINLNGYRPDAGEFEVRVVNPLTINGHNYMVTFNNVDDIYTDPPNPTYNITDLTASSTVLLSNQPTDGASEGPQFGGVRLYIKNRPTRLDLTRSRWNNNDIMAFDFERFIFAGGIRGTRKASDYKIVFGNVGTGRSVSGNIGSINCPAKNVNFNVYNTSTNQKIDFVFLEVDSLQGGGPGCLSSNGASRDRIIFRENIGGGKIGYTYWTFLNSSAGRFPASGDTLVIKQVLAFSELDTIYFSTQKIFTEVGSGEGSVISDYSLDQNYPNPFNPSTKIRFTLSESGPVTLKLYDMLGREVATLLNEEKHAGTHIYEFNAGPLASGVYIYRLQAGRFTANRKLVLIK